LLIKETLSFYPCQGRNESDLWGKVVLYQLSYFRILFFNDNYLFCFILAKVGTSLNFGARSCSTNWAIFAKKSHCTWFIVHEPRLAFLSKRLQRYVFFLISKMF
jgi:hypothetical protein